MTASPLIPPKRLLWALLLVLAAASVNARDQGAPVGKVVVASGDVIARSDDGDARPLERRSGIHQGETVVTGDDGRVQIRFEDGAIVALDSASRLVIENYRFTEDDASEDHAVLRLLTGGLRTLSGQVAKKNPDDYEVRTPLASIGVRGTDYQLALTDEVLDIAVWSGRVVVTNQAGELPLGTNANYRYARITDRGLAPEGRLRPPEPVEQTRPRTPYDASDSSDNDTRGRFREDSMRIDQRPSRDTEPEEALTERDALKNRLEADLEERSESIERFVPDEFSRQSLATSSALTEFENEDSNLFIAPSTELNPDMEQYIVDRNGTFRSLEGPGLERFEEDVGGFGVNWGAWNGQPDLLFHENGFDETGEALAPLSQPLFLASASGLNLDEVRDLRGTNDNLMFEMAAASIGQLRDQPAGVQANFADPETDVFGQMNLDLGTGDLTGRVEVSEINQNLVWDAQLTGQLADNAPFADLEVSELTFNGEEQSAGQAAGLVTSDDQNDQFGFLTNFQFETDDGSSAASGILLLEEL